MTIEKDDCDFYAETDKGIGFKITVDILKNLLSKTIFFKIDKKGIFTSQGNDKIDSKSQNYVKTSYTFDTWNSYLCNKERFIETNLHELCQICKSIKKKCSLLLYIKKNEPNQLYIMPIPQNHNNVTETHLTRRLPITDINLQEGNLPLYIDDKNNYSFHTALSSNLFHSMCKNFSSAKSSIFSLLMYKSGRIYCNVEGTFSDCFFENGKGTAEEKEHEKQYKEYLYLNQNTKEGVESKYTVDDIENILSFPFFTGSFNCKLLKHIQKINGYNSNIHIYTNPIDREAENPFTPLCIKCVSNDSFTIEIFFKSNEQMEFENNTYYDE